MGQITILLPKTYFEAFNKAVIDYKCSILGWTGTENNCVEVTVDGLSDAGELVMLGMLTATYQAKESFIQNSVDKILNDALKHLEP